MPGKLSRFRWLRLFPGFLAAILLTDGARGEDCPSAKDAPVSVVSLPDARTVVLADGRQVRPAGLESFALLQVAGADADEALAAGLRTLLGGSSVAVVPVSAKADRHGRIPALLFLPDGPLVQEILASGGLAIAWTGEADLPCFNRILAAEDIGRRSHAGRWGGDLAQLPEATPAALHPFVGGFAVFEGKVATVGARPARTYLNFGGRWAEDVTVTVSARDREAFGGEAALKALAGRRVRVRGFVEDHGGPAVAVRSPAQLEVLPILPASVAEKP